MTDQSNMTMTNGDAHQNDDLEKEDKVTPWEVEAESMNGIDYDKLISRISSDYY